MVSLCFVRSEGSDKVQNVLGVAFGLDAAPFATKDALAVDDEGAALDAANRFSVQLLVLDDAELRAERLAAVGKQVERQVLFGLEVLVRAQAVTRDAGDNAVCF